MKAYNIDKFADRLDEIFEQGAVGKALIIDAYNKAVADIDVEVERRLEGRQLTDQEIEENFTTPHYHYEKGHYYKVRKDRIFGAKWYRSRLTCSEKPNNTKRGGE